VDDWIQCRFPRRCRCRPEPVQSEIRRGLEPVSCHDAARGSIQGLETHADQTLEPTQVAGFNQFFDDGEGTEAWRYGVGIDQRFSATVYGGAEFSKRDMEVPFLTAISPGVVELRRDAWQEYQVRSYLYWTPWVWLAAGVEYFYEQLDRDEFGGFDVVGLQTHRLVPALNFFHPSGLGAWLRATYVHQDGDFGNPAIGIPVEPGEDNFWIVDAAVSYRLPQRWGLIELSVRNLFDERFRFQDQDPANPSIYPERLLLARFTLSF
jgi:hypothetical protein